MMLSSTIKTLMGGTPLLSIIPAGSSGVSAVLFFLGRGTGRGRGEAVLGGGVAVRWIGMIIESGAGGVAKGWPGSPLCPLRLCSAEALE